MPRARRRLPDYVDQRQLDCIALILDIEYLESQQHAANLSGDAPEVARLGGLIRCKAAKAKQLLFEMRQMAGKGEE